MRPEAPPVLILVLLFIAAVLSAAVAIMPVQRLRRHGLPMIAVGGLLFALANVLLDKFGPDVGPPGLEYHSATNDAGVALAWRAQYLLMVTLAVGVPVGLGTWATLRWAFLRLQRAVHPARLIGAALIVAAPTTAFIAKIALVRAMDRARAMESVWTAPAESAPVEAPDVPR